MSLPELSHLQAAVLDALGPRDTSGRDLRAALLKSGIRKDGPAFYQLMARLEDAKFVDGRYVEDVIDGQRIKERHYSMTGQGEVALRASRDFYSPIIARHEAI